MFEKSLTKSIAIMLTIALFAQQAYGTQLQECIDGAAVWRDSQIASLNAIYDGNNESYEWEYSEMAAYATEYALTTMVVFGIVVFMMAGVCTALTFGTGGGAGPACFAALANAIEFGLPYLIGIVGALLAFALAAKIKRMADNEVYRTQDLATAETQYNEDVALCNLQYGG